MEAVVISDGDLSNRCPLPHAAGTAKRGWSASSYSLRRKTFRSKARITNTLLGDLLFANNAAFVAYSAEDLQLLTNKFVNSCQVFFGLEVSEKRPTFCANMSLIV